MLGLRFDSVDSVEIEDTPAVRRSESILKGCYGTRFNLIISNSEFVFPKLHPFRFDAAYVDGDHSLEAVKRDLDLCRTIGIKTVLMDDWLPKFGTALEAVDACGWTTQLMIGNFLIANRP